MCNYWQVSFNCICNDCFFNFNPKDIDMNRTISREELHRRMLSAAQPTLIEALPQKYYADKHLPRALNMPHDQVDTLAPALLPDKGAEVVVYCANRQCQNSHMAAHRLTALGYTNVAVYPDGKQDWEEAGLPLESETESAVPA
jgi:rhodanese-related sulfurtransferase